MQRDYWIRQRTDKGIVWRRVIGNVRLKVWKVQDTPERWLWQAKSDMWIKEGVCRTPEYAKHCAVRTVRQHWRKRRD